MKIRLIWVGKTDETYLKQGFEKYSERLKHYCSFEIVEIPDVKGGLQADVQKKKEGEMIIKALGALDRVFLLDESGKEYSSREFAGFIQKQNNSGIKGLCFVIGGPFGFSQEVTDKAEGKISLSKMTFSHQMIRLFFAEQLYRAHTILKGEKYHND